MRRLWLPERHRGALGLGLGLGLGGSRRAVAAPNPLLTDLAAYYKLEEASGPAIDSGPNGLDLTAVNNPVGAAGKVGTARAFAAASSQYLERTNVNQLDNLGAVWLSARVYLDSDLSSVAFSISRGDLESSSANIADFVYSSAVKRFLFAVRRADGTTFSVQDAQLGQPALQTWYLLNGWYDPTTQHSYLKINDLAADESSSTWASLFQHTNPRILVGARYTNGIPWNGRVDEAGIWRRVPTADDLALLWNGGAGRTLF